MSDDQITNGRRAALALDAISTYTRMSPYEGLPEDYFFFLDSERETGPGTDHDRLAGLLCGLMHYAERRRLSFADALADASRDYNRQRTRYLPEEGCASRSSAPPRPDSAPLTGEIATARPGDHAFYLVDFITSREWVAEPDLTPAQPFPAIAASTARSAQPTSPGTAWPGPSGESKSPARTTATPIPPTPRTWAFS